MANLATNQVFPEGDYVVDLLSPSPDCRRSARNRIHSARETRHFLTEDSAREFLSKPFPAYVTKGRLTLFLPAGRCQVLSERARK